MAGCDLTSSRSDDTLHLELIPLDVGNQWIWHTESFNVETGAPYANQYADTAYVVSSTDLEGETWFRILGTGNGSLLATNRESGHWVRPSSDTLDIAPRLTYKFPVDVGDTFSAPFPAGSTFRVAATDTTITVPAGSFEAILYEQQWDDFSLTCDVFVAPGVGLIKKVTPWLDGQTNEVVRIDTQELVSFIVK